MKLEKYYFDTTFKRLNNVARYSSHPVIKTESVAEHSYWVSFFALLIAKDINYNNDCEEVDIELLLQKCILHDIGESQTGDIIRPFKYYNKDIHKAIKNAEDEIVTETLNKELHRVYIALDFQDTLDYCKDDSIEGDILILADMISLFTYCFDEVKLGNKNMVPVIKQGLEVLDERLKTTKHLVGYISKLKNEILRRMKDEC